MRSAHTKIPGLLDLQVNGFKGVDFSNPDLEEEKFIETCRMLLANGTSSFLPAVTTSPEDSYRKILTMMARVLNMPEFKSRLPGIHVEGPFISPESGACGVHNQDFIRKPDIDLLDKLFEWSDGKLKLLTIAAEVEGAEEITRHAVSLGIIVSLGHQMADESDIDRVVEAGASAMTHLGNGLPAFIQRHHNPLWAGLSNDSLTALLITDGHHLPPAVIKSFIKAKGVSRCIVTSDASPLAGMMPGNYIYGGESVILEENGLLHNDLRGCLAGSSSTMIECMNYLASMHFLTFDELLRVGFYNPLELLGIKPETIQPERDIFFDEESGIFSFDT